MTEAARALAAAQKFAALVGAMAARIQQIEAAVLSLDARVAQAEGTHGTHVKAKPGPQSAWSAERLARAEDMYRHGHTAAEVLAVVNAMPGRPLSGVQAIYAKASEMDWRRDCVQPFVAPAPAPAPAAKPAKAAPDPNRFLQQPCPVTVEHCEDYVRAHRLPPRSSLNAINEHRRAAGREPFVIEATPARRPAPVQQGAAA